MANGFLTGLAAGVSKVVDRRQRQKLELALQSQKLESEFALTEQKELIRREGEFELFKQKEEFRRVTPETTGLLGEMFPKRAPGGLFQPEQRISPGEAKILSGLIPGRKTGLNIPITDPTNPLIINAAERAGITPEILAAKGLDVRQLSLLQRQQQATSVENRFGIKIEETQKGKIKGIEGRFATSEVTLNNYRAVIGNLSPDRIGAFGKGLEIKIQELAQTAEGDSEEDQLLRKMAVMFSDRARGLAALGITKGLSGVQMRPDEVEAVKAAFPRGTDTIAYAKEYLDLMEEVILSAKDAEILAIVAPISKNPSVLASLRRGERRFKFSKGELLGLVGTKTRARTKPGKVSADQAVIDRLRKKGLIP